ncbi:virion structural protein [Pectobacterium phage vB_PcaM_CBB]|uniref:Structural protein n=1 Tax=Pectobacterium phage vB_PcaM_CBB TaxID=2772511 RepID=A0A1L2CUV1_9CAUD|nr:virion structural protein [Pectobacterium phage vB_PcaM_CBB]AMM43801.1 structural protein [Pectobacterium phage vB_PcaM_CBB]
MANEFKFQASKISEAVNQKLFIKRLPEWMQGLEQIQMFCDDIIQQWFNPADEEIVDGYIGDRGSPAASGKIFLNELDLQRQDYQFSTAYVSRNADTSVRSIQFYPDLVGYLEHYGALTDNQARLLSGKYYAWTPPINPNKLQNYSSYLWDTQNEYGINPDYVVMERGALNGNTWSLQNFWYTVGQTLPDGTVVTEQMAQSGRFARAAAPIIEFNKNIELVNYGTRFRGVVDYLSDSVKPEDIVQKDVGKNVRIDGFVLQAGDRILFTSIGNPGENNRIYKVYIKQMADGTRVYGLVLDEDEETTERPTGEPLTGDVVLVRKGNVYGNTSVYWNGREWTASQAKPGVNTFPIFQLYDKNGIKLNDSTVYPSSTFTGSNLFGLKINYNYGLDKVYGQHVELNQYNYYIFENFLQTQRFTYSKAGAITEIPGLYFYNVIAEADNGELEQNLKSDWVRSTEESKQYVRQVPEVTKTSMYKVFNTISEMNLYKSPIENMYAYVVENDSTYKYYKPSNSTFMKWNLTTDTAVQSDRFEHTYELAQKINPTDSSESLEVFFDGVKTFDYSTVLNADGNVQSIVFDDELTINEDSIVEIVTYSATKVPDLSLGSYQVPINLQNNPYNEFVDYIDQGEYTPHFLDIIGKNITEGSVNDLNNYETRLEADLVDNSVGTKIIQNETSLLPLMLHSANENLDLFSAIIFTQYEYFRFKNKFSTQMMNMYNADPSAFMSESASNIVDMIFSKINVGKDNSFPFALDNVGSNSTTGKTFIPPTPQFLGILKAFRPEKATYLHLGRDIGCYNIDHMGVASKAYRVINGIDLMDDVIYELENRIFSSIDNAFKIVDFQPAMDEDLLKPTPYFNSTEYSINEYNQLELRGYVNFIATNGIDNSTHDYDPNNWMTWNYTGTTYVVNGQPTTIPARGSWRAIYTDMFGTYRPHTHPWEMFGFSQRPDWFNQEYEPTKVRLGQGTTEYVYVYTAYVIDENGDEVPSGLWDTTSGQGDASTGTILHGARAGQYDRYKRFGTQPFEIVKTGVFTTDGEEICELNLIAPEVLGLVSGALAHISEPWAYGDMGDMEFTYMNTVMYAYDKAMALLRAKPGQFANYFYDTKGSTIQKIASDGEQFLYGESNKRLNFNDTTIVHTENNQRILGYQTWVSDYLVYQNKDVTSNYGDILRSSYVNVGHRIGGYTKQDQLTFSSDSFGLVSQENQHIGLVKSAAFRDEVLSAVKIQWTGSGFAISGYDLVGAKLTYKVPNKTGRRVSIQVGKRSVIHYNEYLDKYESYEYGTLLKTYQEVYTFLCGYGEYLKDSGWIFEDVNEDGVTQDWSVIGKDFISWSATSPAVGDFISVSPSTKNAKFGTTFGSVQSVTQFNGGVWSLLDDTNTGIRPYEIDTSRIGNVFSVRLNDESDKRMALIRVSVVAYEHAVIFDDKTIFGNNIYVPKYGVIHEMLKMYGYVTGSWNGRLEAPGFIILEAGTMPDFEKLVDDFQHYYDNDNPVDNVTLRNLARHLIGFQTRDYISQMITSDTSQIDFYKGFIRDKGTNQVFERVLRVSKSYNTDNYKALQEWAFKIGEYGNIYGKKHLQFQLINNEFAQEPQLFTFDQNATSDSSENNIVYYGTQGIDSRWITRPKGQFAFPMRSGKSERIHLPDIGPVTLDEVSYSTRDFTTAYADRLSFISNTDSTPTSVWVFRDMDNNWNIYELVNTGIKLNSITPIGDEDNYPGNHCTLQLSAAHGMEDGDYFFFVDESEYMPDLLKAETQYFTTGSNPTSFVIPLNVTNTITFSGDNPVLYRYVNRFSTTEQKNAYITKKYSYDAPESTLFVRPTTYNKENNVTELYMNTYDPINGVIPGSIMSDITYVSPVDPAKYNSDEETTQAWGSEKVGLVWWNTTNAFFMDYTRPIYDASGNVDEEATNNYKRYNWGKLLPNSEINVLEWVASPVLPYDWAKYCERQAKLNKDSTAWVPSGDAIEDYYSEFQEYDVSTNSYKTVYYFWVQNAIYVPKVKNRNKPCNELARTIKEPSLLNAPWFAPISTNSFIISGLQQEITDDKSILSITYQNDATEVIKHDQYQLCKEGLDYNFNPVIWNSMWNSLISQEVLPDGKTSNLIYPINDNGILPGETWFQDPIEARRTFVDSANAIYKTINVTTNTVVMNDVFNVKTEEENPNLISFKVLNFNNELVINPSTDAFVENDAVLVSSNGTLPSPLNSTTVYFVHFDENNYIRLMNSPSTGGSAVYITLENRGEGQHKMIKQADYIESLGTSLDMTQYWSLADWYDIGYNENTSYTDELSIDAANQKNYQEGDVIRITDADGVWTLYVKSLSRNVVIWQAVARQNSTVALNNQLYNGYKQYNEDGSLTNVEINVRKALSLLKNSFNTTQSRLVFDMVKYVHTEQTVVDWVFKTSYIYIVGLEQSLQQNNATDNLISQIVEYFEEVKPYRTKIRSQIEQKTSDTDEMLGLSNDLDPNGYIFTNGAWIKTQDDIWDHEYAQYNSTTGKWEIIGSLPSDFVYPNRRFQESYEMFVYDNFQCTPDADLNDRLTLEAVNNSFMSNKDDLLLQGNHYKLQRYAFTYPEIDSSTINSNVSVGISAIYPQFNTQIPLVDAINEMLESLKDDVAASEQFDKDLQQVYNSVLNSDSTVKVAKQYTQYNTLANRRRLYTQLTDTNISQEMGCPFKGRVLTDNLNTRLPFGFSAVNSENYGYIMYSRDLYEHYVELVKESHPSFTDAQINDYLVYEYGLYPWKVDMDSIDEDTGSLNGKNYLDTLYVLTAMRNTYNPDAVDQFEVARQILAQPTIDMYCMVMIPRKLVLVQNVATEEFLEVPMDVSLDDFMQERLIINNDVVTLLEPDLNDLALDINNPLYDNIQNVLETISGKQYLDDANAFDNSGLESQTRDITYYASGAVNSTQDPVYVDISDINPLGLDVAQMRFTVNGYGYNTSGNIQLKSQGNFQIEGYVVQNPYNMKEAIVSIPRYEAAIEYMQKNLIAKNEIRYSYRIKDVINTTGTIRLVQKNDFKVGEKVMVFVPEGTDYDVLMSDNTMKTILPVANIKNGTRPRIFTVSSVSGDTIRLGGLSFSSTYDSTSDTLMVPSASSINVVRITSFTDPEFVNAGVAMYSTERSYRISVLDYDMFYDRMIIGSKYSNAFSTDDYDDWYTSNEIVEIDGVEVDHGYYLPIYGKGVLSELVRAKMDDSLQIFVYEYPVESIKPVKNGNNWTYTGTLVDGVYISDKNASLVVAIRDTAQGMGYVAKPTHVESTSIANGILTSSNASDTNLVAVNNEIVLLRNGRHMLRGMYGTAENNYVAGTTYTNIGVILGAEGDWNVYNNFYPSIPLNTFSTGYTVTGTQIGQLL